VPARSTFNILAYHRIATPGSRDLSPALIDAYPADFEAQMRYVAEHYSVLSSWDIVRALREHFTLPKRALVITFDDGYTCFRDTAMPILRRLGLPVTLFVATAFTGSPGTRFRWDAIYHALANTELHEVALRGVGRFPLSGAQKRMETYDRIVAALERTDERQAALMTERLLEQCKVEPSSAVHLLGWDDVKELHEEGVAVGPHSRRHPILSKISAERVDEEVAGSWADLQEHLARPLPLFCYPNGQPHSISGRARQAVKAAGMAGAVTMIPDRNVLGSTDPFMMRRIGAVGGESFTRFRLKIGPVGRFYRRIKSLAKRKTHSASKP
jgi:peptidoglycan/xylan/chitin deacetylase (PgdA/CDA1 family)